MKLIDYQYTYKKQVGFTQQQRKAFDILKNHGVSINQFIRASIDEKLQRDWKEIKESKNKKYCPF